ncbi:MAG: HEPN domain-containing protein [Candidatus Korarchaeota archaeon]|nr:HEPN domain-containing protein [Candidatus Korarchaeota archaeon]NIU83866.1 HEPN domain-containing protein [Candidatus Thorarchaeota archaeon]NIW14010.1 HEPN domain-containing protein [Candidatus Thorarchaeota archaeon]NIW52122.1 HEPN domain-containing protein [Candidatus Korarchaeota archaeon]
MVFGSYVRTQEHEDIDLLLVLEEIEKNRIERIEDIVGFKRKIHAPLDLLLLSKEECRANFRNHNPLFLEIAMDGEILLDTHNFLRSLMEETRTYIKEKKIRRTTTEWVFPTEKREIPLSDVTNKDWAESWLKDAKRDLKSAKILYQQELYEKTVYHAQQCVEKAVKATLICFGRFAKTHYVADILRKEMKQRDLDESVLETLIHISEQLEPHHSLRRYPWISDAQIWVPSKEYDQETANDALQNAQKAISLTREFLQKCFGKEC